jgi:multidrug efflux pump subunit AcrA (membrane-fusion protein)
LHDNESSDFESGFGTMTKPNPFNMQLAFAAGLPTTPLPLDPSSPDSPSAVSPEPRGPEPQRPGPRRPGRKISRRWLLLPFLIGAAGGYTLYQQQAQQTAQPDSVSSAGTVKAVRGDLLKMLRVGGTISAENSAAVVAPRLRRRGGSGGSGGGRGSMVLLSMAPPGEFVEKGEIVAEFDRQSQLQSIDDQHALVVQAQANIDKLKAELSITFETARQQLRMAKAEWEKAQLDLRTAEVRSEIEAEILALAVEETEATYMQLQEEVKWLESSHAADLRALKITKRQQEIKETRAQIDSEKMVMRAAISGMVVRQTVFRGGGQFSQVQAGDEVRSGTFFLQIVDPAGMILNGDLNQVDSQAVRAGQRVEIRLDAYPDKVWPGRVTAVGAIAGGGGGMMSIRRGGQTNFVRNVPVAFATETQAKEIIPDLSGSADILLAAHEDVVLVPNGAIQSVGEDRRFVYVRAAGARAFIKQPVETGQSNSTHTAILSGLEEGAEIALKPPVQI